MYVKYQLLPEYLKKCTVSLHLIQKNYSSMKACKAAIIASDGGERLLWAFLVNRALSYLLCIDSFVVIVPRSDRIILILQMNTK